MKDKIRIIVTLFVVLIIILLVLSKFSEILEEDKETVATPPMKINISLSKVTALGELTEITANIWYTGKIKEGMPETVANIELPEGFELVDGDLSWEGYVKNEPQQFGATIKAMKIGNWTIKSKIRSPPTGENYIGGWGNIYISVFEDRGIISEEPFQSPREENGDRAIKINDLNIPEAIPDKDIITPEATSMSLISPMKINISLSKVTALGELTEIAANIWYTGKIKEGMPETVANIELPEGFELVDGDLSWEGYVKNEPQQFGATIKAMKIGNWTIKSKIRSPPTGENYIGGWGNIYISVFEDRGITYLDNIMTPFKNMDINENNDLALKLSDSRTPPEKETLVNNNIKIPEPTIEIVTNTD